MHLTFITKKCVLTKLYYIIFLPSYNMYLYNNLYIISLKKKMFSF